MENDKNAELKEILAKQKVEREKNQKPKQENISIAKAEKFRAKQEQFKKEFENKKQNDPNFRDYDENPLIIQSYEKYIVSILFFSNLLITGSICVILRNIYTNSFNSYEYMLGIILALCIIIGMFVYHNSSCIGHKIKFTNQHIEFIDNGKLKRKCNIAVDELVKPFGQDYISSRIITYVLIALFIFLTIISYGIFAIIIAIFYLVNIVIKIA
ncbi:MAG: hypothetical protein II923_03765, partial [Campylobacter sp.]|nr:hypothetical protein [Campylobacter sp.]